MRRSSSPPSSPPAPSVAALALGCLVALGCRGKLIASVSLSGPGTAEARFQPGKTTRLWADFNGEWTGPGSKSSRPPIAFDIDVLQGGKSVGKLTCQPDNGGTSVCSGKTSVGNDHSGNCEFSMTCSLPSLGAGEVTLKVTGRVTDPSRLKKVTNMSLNVRDD
jgi:hypothetical protein